MQLYCPLKRRSRVSHLPALTATHSGWAYAVGLQGIWQVDGPEKPDRERETAPNHPH